MSDHQSGAGQQPPQLNAPTGSSSTIRVQQLTANTNPSSRAQYILSSQVLPSNSTPQADNSPRIVIPSQRVNIHPNRTSDLPTSVNNNNHGAGGNENKSSSTQQQQMVGHPVSSAINASSHPTLVSSLSSPPRQRPASVTGQLLNSSPQQTVRTSNPSIVNTLSTPPLQSHSSNRNCKNVPLKELPERPPINDEIAAKRRKILDYKMDKVQKIEKLYAENASELFFLNAGGNLIDYFGWRKRCINSPQFLLHLRSCRLDPENHDEDLTIFLRPQPTTSSNTTSTLSSQLQLTASPDLNLKSTSTGGQTLHSTSTSLATQNALNPETISTQNVTPDVTSKSITPIAPTTIIASSVDKTTNVPSTSTSNTNTSATSTITSSSPKSANKLPFPPPLSRQHTRQHSISAVYETSIGSQEQIAEKAKQEAYVIQRIAELQREGLWSERRLPKVQEPARTKAHWDYLMEEMAWLSADFAQERKWKKAAAKKCARNVQKYFQEKAIQAQKAEKTQELRLKKIASFMAKEVKIFWANVEKLVEYKHQTRLEEKRKQALDQHLSFIVDQTEKYSSWLAEGMNKSQHDVTQSVTPSANSSRVSSPTNRQKLVTSNSDDEFKPTQSSSDDEETIAKAEADMGTQVTDEIEMLKRESELPIEDFLDLLPESYLEAAVRQDPLPEITANSEEDEEPERDSEMDTSVLAKSNSKSTEEDEEYAANEDENNSTDDEETIQREEQQEATEEFDHEKEIADLEADNELTIEELKAKYSSGPSDSLPLEEDMEADQEEDEEVGEDEESEMDIDEDEDGEDEDEKESEEMGLESLLEETSEKVDDNEKANKEITDVAALAESIQPKGNTLSSTSVVTPVPFLLKHSLREYQHIGLDWLVTMFDRKLNGILADEMGLGKTIQTISLLAHLACEKEIWGPHLIIVPTSVMLNWEMELKKWCPAFKILTYYGTQKERKQKRTGWTKPNAFHVCITSYKLVIQDHQSFRRKKWKYLILDEAQNIKNFKSQRWQLLLNFQTQRRLLLTGTPLQNNLMELWSLMHFLMPHVFQSHREFKEWFSNPVTGMIEGNSEYNESIIKRLHKVLRPFLLRRLKSEVEKQLPKKYEHVVMCRLSKRQRFLYDDFMSRAKTKETLATGNLLSVINVLMQLRKVCNHPNLFEVRPILSPFQMESLEFHVASFVFSALNYDPFKHVSLESFNLLLINLELSVSAFTAHRVNRLKPPRKLIEELDSTPNLPPPCPKGQINVNVQPPLASSTSSINSPMAALKGVLGQQQNSSARVGTSPRVKTLITNPTLQGNKNTLQIVQPQPATPKSNKNTLQIVQPQQTTSLKTLSVTTNYVGAPRYAQLLQTSSGKHILVTSTTPSVSNAGQRVAVLSKPLSFTTTNRPLVRVVNANQAPQSAKVNAISTSTETKTSTSLTQPVLAALVHQSQTTSSIRSTPSSRSKREEKGESIYRQVELEEIQARRRKEHLVTIAGRNQRRCSDWPIYGSDLRDSCQAITNSTTSAFASERKSGSLPVNTWRLGYTHCINAQTSSHHPSFFWTQTDALATSILSIQDRVDQLKNIFSRFVLYVPAVSSPQPRLHSSHPPPSNVNFIRTQRSDIRRELAPGCIILHPIISAMLTQFPEPRLIQYDCGKLQTLDSLLRRLKTGHHRVLIFTQMTRMLDVLEAFLTFHGHIYLRLDGTTRVDQRQMLMERFNADKRIFCFILSTRSGGIGVNLTGADTVIFYDSDWNPTMDAQAQDRCHRIGQTRDVHIYRLVSEMTVEENILKKANQKRLLGDLAIEGGNFTTAYFKSTTIQDLFNIDVGENDASKRMADVLERSNSQRKLSSDTPTPNSPQTTAAATPVEDQKVALGALESALAAAEDEWDVQATRTAKAEAAAELAEFDEDIPLEDAVENSTIQQPEISKAEQEFQNLVQQLTPIERYAMRIVEETEATEEHLAAAEAEIEQQKREWELGRIQALRDEEKRRAGLAEEESAENLVTFSREDAQNQVDSSNSGANWVSLGQTPARRRPGRPPRKAGGGKPASAMIRPPSPSSSPSSSSSSSSDDSQSNSESEENGPENSFGSEEEEDIEVDSDPPTSAGQKAKSNRMGGFSRGRRSAGLTPRTRSRGSVSINLWTLDVSPVPGTNDTTSRPPIKIKLGRGRPRKRPPSPVATSSPQPSSTSPGSVAKQKKNNAPTDNGYHTTTTLISPYSHPKLVIRTRRASSLTPNES